MDVNVTLEFTPNPNTLKFVVNRALMPQGAANFTTPEGAEHAPLAQSLFQVKGVQAVMVGTNFVTITKSAEGSWDVLAEQVPAAIEKHFKANKPVFDAQWKAPSHAAPGSDSAVVTRIREILDRDIRPAVAMDGGDITFDRFENGVVYLHLQGACSSCPSSVMTLKMGVESRLRDQIPEIKEVVQV